MVQDDQAERPGSWGRPPTAGRLAEKSVGGAEALFWPGSAPSPGHRPAPQSGVPGASGHLGVPKLIPGEHPGNFWLASGPSQTTNHVAEKCSCAQLAGRWEERRLGSTPPTAAHGDAAAPRERHVVDVYLEPGTYAQSRSHRSSETSASWRFSLR